MKPSVGRIVHYTNLGDRDGKYPPEVQAAIITRVIDLFAPGPDGAPLKADSEPSYRHEADESRYRVSIHVFYPTGQFDMPDVKFAGSQAGGEAARGMWAWPVRENA